MKKYIVIILLFVSTLGLSQSTGSYWKVTKWSSPFGSDLPDSVVVFVKDSAKYYQVHHIGGVTSVQTMQYASNLGWISNVPPDLNSYSTSIHIPLIMNTTIVNMLDSAHISSDNYQVDTTIFILPINADYRWSLAIRFDCMFQYSDVPYITLYESCDNGITYIPMEGEVWPLAANGTGYYDLDPNGYINCDNGNGHYLWNFQSEHFYGDHLKLVVSGYRENNSDPWTEGGDVYTISAWILLKK